MTDQNSNRPTGSGKMRKQLGALMVAGTEFGVVTVAGIIAGSYLDSWLGTVPIFFFIGMIGGFIGGLLLLIRLVKVM